MKQRKEPPYPDELRAAGIQGTVVLALVVDEKGLPTEIRVIRPLGYGLDERAVDAVNQWRFEPARKDGMPMKFPANMEVNFGLFGNDSDSREENRKQYNSAVEFLKGDASKRELALDILQKLVKKSYPPAVYAYGRLLGDGKEVPLNLEMSRELIGRAARAKYGPAMYSVASEYLKAKDDSKRREEGQGMMREAARFGSIEAQYLLGQAYEHGDSDLGLEQDTASARDYYRLCAAVGLALCQLKLGELSLDRPDLEKLEAIAWLELAADQGESRAKPPADAARTGLDSEQIKKIVALKKLLGPRN